MKKMYSIQTTKKDGIWECHLLTSFPWEQLPILEDTIEEGNYSDLMIKVADKGWIDLINKNE